MTLWLALTSCVLLGPEDMARLESGPQEACTPLEESCNAADDDCDGVVDEGLEQRSWYLDRDQDGYGAGEPIEDCGQPEGHTTWHGDCDDQEAGVFPGASESCDGEDQDCDDAVDEGLPETWEDEDGDGYGAPGTAACDDAAGDRVDNDDDCDDDDPRIRPGAVEHCNGVQEDCGDASWDADAGVVSWESQDGTWTDWSAVLSDSSTAPAALTLTEQGTLWVCPGTWYAHLTVETDLAIRGVGEPAEVTLSGVGLGPVVETGAGWPLLTLSRLTVEGGLGTSTWFDEEAESAGGGVSCTQGGHVTADEVIITGNNADNAAGVYLEGCDGTFTDVTFDTNEAWEYGGALGTFEATVIIDGASFTGNTAGGSGGGLYTEDTTLTLSNSAFTDNHGLGQGNSGGAMLLYWTTIATIEGSTFDGNTANNGGAAYFGGSEIAIADSTFTGNDARYGGGAISYYTSEVTITDSEFVGNIADDGGALRSAGSTLDTTRVTFQDNSCDDKGGAIDLTGGTAVLVDTRFVDNTAPSDDGVVRWDSDRLELLPCDFTGSTPADLMIPDSGEQATCPSGQDIVCDSIACN